MSILSQNTPNQNINTNPLQKSNESSPKEYHPLEFYTLGKINPNINTHNLFNSNSYSSKTFSKLSYNHSSHELFNRNLLSVNSPYFDKYKEVKPNIILNSSIKNENNYLEPLISNRTRNDINRENQKMNNINSLEWFHLIKNKVYIADQNSKITKGNNITRDKFYQEKGISQSEQKVNSTKGYDACLSNNNINKIRSIFNGKRFKQGNDNLPSKKEIVQREKEVTQIDNNEDNYWRQLRIGKSFETQSMNDNDFKKLNEKTLKSNFLYFDKNYKNIIRHKNWWKIDP